MKFIIKRKNLAQRFTFFDTSSFFHLISKYLDNGDNNLSVYKIEKLNEFDVIYNCIFLLYNPYIYIYKATSTKCHLVLSDDSFRLQKCFDTP